MNAFWLLWFAVLTLLNAAFVGANIQAGAVTGVTYLSLLGAVVSLVGFGYHAVEIFSDA